MMKKIRNALLSGALLLSFVILAPGSASGEEEVLCPPNVDYCLDVQVLEVRVPRPSAFYVINRSTLQHNRHNAEQNFTNDVVDSLERSPF